MWVIINYYMFMFRNIFRTLNFTKLSTPSKLVLAGFTTIALSSYLSTQTPYNKLLPSILMMNKIRCLETTRANKQQIIKILDSAKEQYVVLIYNRQSQNSLRFQIIQCQEIAKKLGIRNLVLVDQTDVRHLDSFARILREDVDDEDQKSKQKQAVNLQNKISILYISPTFNPSKPFKIRQSKDLEQEVKQIRSILKQNPSQAQLQGSINTVNMTTVLKNCTNTTCIDEYKQKIRNLIELQLFRNKIDNFQFYLTTAKNQATKINSVVEPNNNSQEIYVWRNDMLGKEKFLFSQFVAKEGANYSHQNRFMMMIRPRVHILNRQSFSTDLFWYITTIRLNSVPTFSINNTMNNLPVKVVSPWKQENAQDDVVMMKGHPQEVQLIAKLKKKYGNKLQILVMETNVASELLRHVYQQQRYCIFNLSPEVPYPKLFITPPTLTLTLPALKKIPQPQSSPTPKQQQQQQPQKSSQDTPPTYTPQNWSKVLQKVQTYIQKPANYGSIKIYTQKQMQINADKLKQMLDARKQSKDRKDRWIFRVCGVRNTCQVSVFQKYGYALGVPTYKIDSKVQNVGIDEGDYDVQGDIVTKMI